jgi:Kef-type K+ transport system membrane component KefB
MNDSALAALVFLQLAVILLTCRLIGWLARRIGQPQVVAEMVAGFLLGPSLLGWMAPQAHAVLFPREALAPLYVLSQVGLALYMFTVGLEFQSAQVARHVRRAAWISVAGFAAPFALAAGLAGLLLQTEGLFAAGVTRLEAVLFLGAALSITAFPMLARMLDERGMAGTTIGTLVLVAGAVNDAAAWILLAIVLAGHSGDALLGLRPAAGGLIYVLLVFTIVRWLFRRLAFAVAHRESIEPWTLSVMLALLAAGAWFTDISGIYSVFGAFILGTAVPRGPLSGGLHRAIAPVTTALLVPLYFVYSGLNARLDLLHSAALWTLTTLVFVAACAGKGLGCWAAARLSGAGSHDAWSVATLMNTRGLMEFVLLNIALERGLITPTLFTMLAIMAIGTTVMAYPLFGLFSPEPRDAALANRAAALEH